MNNHKNIIVAGVAAAIILLSSSALGQIVYGQPASAGFRLIYSHWSIKYNDGATVKINQFMLPVSGFIPIRENVEARFYVADASNKLNLPTEDYTLSGLSDMRLQISSALLDEHLLTSLGINLPTGKKELDFDKEGQVMDYLSLNYLSFPIRRLGEGLGINLLAGLAESSGNTRYGVSACWGYTGAYKAYEEAADYDPGDLFSINAGLDVKGDKTSLAMDMAFTTYGTDELDNQKVFKQSDMFDIHAGWNYFEESYTFGFDSRYLIRGRNTTYDTTAAETIRDQLKIYGNEFFLGGNFFWTKTNSQHFGPVAELRLIGANEYDFGSSSNIGFGFEYGTKLGKSANLGLGMKYYTGKADDGNIDLSGYQVSANLSSTF